LGQRIRSFISFIGGSASWLVVAAIHRNRISMTLTMNVLRRATEIHHHKRLHIHMVENMSQAGGLLRNR
jgi:hypothetical protein